MRFDRKSIIITVVASLALLIIYAMTMANRLNPRTTPDNVAPQGQNAPGGRNIQQIIPGPNQQQMIPGKNQPNNAGTNNQGLRISQDQIADSQKKSDRIRKQLVQMREVDEANVLVVGNTCIVGYKPARTLIDTEATKKEIADRVKAMDNSITNCAVSESGDVMSRVGRISQDITNNRNIDNANNEINELISRIIPTVR